MSEWTVLISQEEYRELLDCQTRLGILMDVVKDKEGVDVKDLCYICGYPKLAKKIHEKEDEQLREFIRKGDDLYEATEYTPGEF